LIKYGTFRILIRRAPQRVMSIKVTDHNEGTRELLNYIIQVRIIDVRVKRKVDIANSGMCLLWPFCLSVTLVDCVKQIVINRTRQRTGLLVNSEVKITQ